MKILVKRFFCVKKKITNEFAKCQKKEKKRKGRKSKSFMHAFMQPHHIIPSYHTIRAIFHLCSLYFFFKWNSHCVCLRLNQYSGFPSDVDPFLGIGLIFQKKKSYLQKVYIFGSGPSTW